MSKELWFAAFEDLMERYLEKGMSEEDAYERAGNEAHDHMIDRLSSQADYLRKRAKENGD